MAYEAIVLYAKLAYIMSVQIRTIQPRGKSEMAHRAYDVLVRRIATGCDYRLRLFTRDETIACERAVNRARQWERIPFAKMEELSKKGIAVFRIVSCTVSLDQSIYQG
jgi:hypothetical protein